MTRTRRRSGRGSVLGLAVAAVLLASAGPAAASHDDHTEGTVILRVAPGADQVVVVRALDADRDALVEEVRTTAEEAGMAVGDVEMGENSEPDTLRARAAVPLSVRQAALTYEVPADHVDAWRPLGEIALDTGRWITIDGAEGSLPAAGEGFGYRVDATVFALALAILLVAAIVPFIALRWYGARVVAADDQPASDRVHRLRRASTAAQLLLPFGLVWATMGLGVGEWPILLWAEVSDGSRLPEVARTPLIMVGLLLPLLTAIVSAALGVLPADRRLRDTDQSTRRGASQALRGALLGILPVLLWVSLVPLLPSGIAIWVLIPLAVLFGLGVAAATPLLIVWTQATGAVPDDVRTRVLAQCDRAGLRVRDVKQLDSQGSRVANAAIAGVIPKLRFVFLTDELLQTVDERELEAVVAHEIAHGKEHHILLKLLAGFVAIAVVAGLVLGLLRPLLEDTGPLLIAMAMPLAVLAAVVLAHGVVGMRLEERADDYAVRQTDAAALAGALEKMAEANGIKRRTGWLWNVMQQHPGLDGRIRRLQQEAGHPASVAGGA